jgi:hypothetical protein
MMKWHDLPKNYPLFNYYYLIWEVEEHLALNTKVNRKSSWDMVIGLISWKLSIKKDRC